jgi:hypothetical protein
MTFRQAKRYPRLGAQCLRQVQGFLDCFTRKLEAESFSETSAIFALYHPPQKKLHCQRHRYVKPQISHRCILCPLHNFTYEHAAVSRGTDKIPNPTAVVLLTQKAPAITATRLSSEIVRQHIDIGGSIIYVPSRGKVNSKFHHKIFLQEMKPTTS